LTNLHTCLDGFGGRDYLDDYKLLKRYRDRAERDFSDYRLSEFVENLAGLCRACQDAQAAAATDMIEALRANPDVDGYCYSQWRDAAWECGPGVVDVWGNPKQPYEAFKRLNQPVNLALRLLRGATNLDRPVEVEAAIINEGVLSGRCIVQFVLHGVDGRNLHEAKVAVELDKARRVTFTEPISFAISGPTGLCRLSAQLLDPSGAKAAEAERQFLYVSGEQWDLSQYDVLAIAPEPRRRSALAASGLRLLAPPALPQSRTVLVSAQGPVWTSPRQFEPLAESLEWINREGGTLLLDCSAGIDPAVERVRLFRGKTTTAVGGFLGKFLLVRFSRRLGWTPARQAMTGEYRSIMPRLALVPEQRDWRADIVLVDGYGRFGGFALAEQRWGAGRVVLFTLPILNILDRDPTARLMLSGLLSYYGEHPRIASPGELDRRLLLARFEGSGEIAGFDWWLCGPFSCPDMASGLRHTFAPESEFETSCFYPGHGDQQARWKRYHSEKGGHISFSDAFGELGNAVAYALAHIHADRPTRTVLHVGSDDAVRVFLNDRLVLESLITRSAAPDQDRAEIVLEEGWNRLLLKVVNESGEWEAYVALDEPLAWSPDRKLPSP